MVQDRNAPDGGHRPPAERGKPAVGEVRLTRLTLADIRDVMRIENICYSCPWSEDSFRQILEDTKTFETLAARTVKGLGGYIVFSEVVDELHILNVAIHPDMRRVGLATFMLVHLHQAAKKRGRRFAYLEVRESNTSAQKLYEKFGYKRLSVRKDYYVDNQENAIVMMAEMK